jgi:hypothetical protein
MSAAVAVLISVSLAIAVLSFGATPSACARFASAPMGPDEGFRRTGDAVTSGLLRIATGCRGRRCHLTSLKVLQHLRC